MNLPKFLKQVDSDISKMTRSELESFIHEIARTLPEEKRPCFLEMMEFALTKPPSDNKIKALKKEESLQDKVKSIIIKITGINNGERCLDSEYAAI